MSTSYDAISIQININHKTVGAIITFLLAHGVIGPILYFY